MISNVRSWLVLSLLLVFLLPGVAQNSRIPSLKTAANSTRLTELRVLGSKRYDASVLATVTGLKLGTDVNEDAMRAGADRLGASGMFSDVSYSYVTAPQGTRVEYKVNDAPDFFPAHFDNFVWMSREELIKKLQERSPLFTGDLPGAGEMYKEVASNLKVILEQKNVKADVMVFPEAPQGGGRIIGFIYTVDGVKIPIRSFEFPGVSAEMSPVLQKAVSAATGSDYSKSGMEAMSRLQLLPIYLQNGFLHATFKAPEVSLVDLATNGVSVRIPVEEGLQYMLDSLQWSGNTVFSSAELAKTLTIAIGKPANKLQLEDDLSKIRKRYGTKGYLRVRIQPTPAFDDSSRKVTYAVALVEGDQYRMGNVIFEGISSTLEGKIRPLWPLRQGDIFDPSCMERFMQGIASTYMFDLKKTSIATRQSIHEETKTVDMVIRFGESNRKS